MKKQSNYFAAMNKLIIKRVFFTSFIIFFVIFANAQEPRYSINDPIEFNESGEITFSEVVHVENASASELYTNVILYISY